MRSWRFWAFYRRREMPNRLTRLEQGTQILILTHWLSILNQWYYTAWWYALISTNKLEKLLKWHFVFFFENESIYREKYISNRLIPWFVYSYYVFVWIRIYLYASVGVWLSDYMYIVSLLICYIFTLRLYGRYLPILHDLYRESLTKIRSEMIHLRIRYSSVMR